MRVAYAAVRVTRTAIYDLDIINFFGQLLIILICSLRSLRQTLRSLRFSPLTPRLKNMH